MFRIGQKVVCVTTTRRKFFIKDKIYTIKHIDFCPHCRIEILFLNVPAQSNSSTWRCVCNGIFNSNAIYQGAISKDFRPLSYSTNCNKEIIEKFSPLEEKSDVKIREYEPVKTSLLK